MPPENPEVAVDSSAIKNGLSKTQIGGLVIAVSGAILFAMNVGDDKNTNSVTGGLAIMASGALTLLVGSIMRPDGKTDSMDQDGEKVFSSDEEENDLTPEEAIRIEGMFGNESDSF